MEFENILTQHTEDRTQTLHYMWYRFVCRKNNMSFIHLKLHLICLLFSHLA